MKDVQNQADQRNIAIDKVGVKDISYPITLLDRAQKEQKTIARVNMYVDLPHHFKGTHMSRFVEILNAHHNNIHVDHMTNITHEMRECFDAKSAHIKMSFPYFLSKKAPVSGLPGMMEYQCFFEAVSNHDGDEVMMGIEVPVMTLCPCSKEISEFGAHNQRGIISIQIKTEAMIWLEDLIAIAEQAGSSPLYSVLKRPDEKFVTEASYKNPKFVEDVVRDVAVALNKRNEITWYQVSAENFESIHNHSAYAFIEKKC